MPPKTGDGNFMMRSGLGEEREGEERGEKGAVFSMCGWVWGHTRLHFTSQLSLPRMFFTLTSQLPFSKCPHSLPRMFTLNSQLTHFYTYHVYVSTVVVYYNVLVTYVISPTGSIYISSLAKRLDGKFTSEVIKWVAFLPLVLT